MPKLNLSDVRPEFKPGVQVVKIKSAEDFTSKKGGAGMRCIIEGAESKNEGNQCDAWFMFEGKGARSTKLLLEALGIKCVGEEIDFKYDDIIGKEFVVPFIAEKQKYVVTDDDGNEEEKESIRVNMNSFEIESYRRDENGEETDGDANGDFEEDDEEI